MYHRKHLLPTPLSDAYCTPNPHSTHPHTLTPPHPHTATLSHAKTNTVPPTTPKQTTHHTRTRGQVSPFCLTTSLFYWYPPGRVLHACNYSRVTLNRGCAEPGSHTHIYYWCFGGFGFVVVGCLWVGCGLFCGGFFVFIFFWFGMWCLVFGWWVFCAWYVLWGLQRLLLLHIYRL